MRGRPTGRDQWEQFHTVTKSSAFHADREALHGEFYRASGKRRGELIEWAQAEVKARKQALRDALAAA